MTLSPEDGAAYYLAGPMSNLPEYNYPAFERIATILRAAGFDIRSPHEIEYDEPNGRGSLDYQVYIEGGLDLLDKCDHIILIKGWAQSIGARTELIHALNYGKGVYYYCEENALLINMNRKKEGNVDG